MKAYGITYISPDLEHGDYYTRMDYKKNPARKKSRSYTSETSQRVLKAAKKKARGMAKTEIFKQLNN